MDTIFSEIEIFEQYNNYVENEIDQIRITNSDVTKLVQKYSSKEFLRIEKVGESIEKREIYCITIGKGRRILLAWSQMHGDEPTATAAIFDLLKFFERNDKYNDLREELLNKLTIYFIPLLNPDGAEGYKRENKISVDLNRDSLKTVTPEAKVLWEVANKVKPEFAFNLHDQNSYYTVGRTGKSSAISMLAPPFNYENTINETRKKSMQLIASINKSIQKLIPNQVARYKDDHEPRSFGDTFTANSISSVLIESGFAIGDRNKSLIRKLNFIALLAGFYSISTNEYLKMTETDYYSIPENQTMLFDLLIRNLVYKTNGQEFRVDLGINREKKFCKELNKFYCKGKIMEVGDLSSFVGINEVDLSGYEVRPAKIFEKEFSELPSNEEIRQIITSGHSTIKIDPFAIRHTFLEKPINLLPSNLKYEHSIGIEELANLSFYQNDQLKYMVINGFICPIENYSNSILNGIVIS